MFPVSQVPMRHSENGDVKRVRIRTLRHKGTKTSLVPLCEILPDSDTISAADTPPRSLFSVRTERREVAAPTSGSTRPGHRRRSHIRRCRCPTRRTFQPRRREGSPGFAGRRFPRLARRFRIVKVASQLKWNIQLTASREPPRKLTSLAGVTRPDSTSAIPRRADATVSSYSSLAWIMGCSYAV